MEALHLYVSVPVASFRVAQAREYWETYPCPPPSTIYGMLLSLVGEPNRLAHRGCEIAVAVVSEPHRSVVLRTLWRVRDAKIGPGLGRNRRPDFQELLSDLRLSIWVRQGAEERAAPPLAARLDAAVKSPADVRRFGGLSLGESTHLVDDLRPWREKDPKTGRLMLQDDQGDLSLPVWPDHVGSQGTRWGQFKLEESCIDPQPREQAWIAISPPGIGS